MPFPKIHNCLICEDLRQEVFRKSTILGFYGIAPRVQILIKDIGQPIARLVFLFLGEPTGAGRFQIAFRIVDDDGNEILKSPPAETLLETGSGNIAWNLQGPVFPKSGKYTFTLLADGVEQYQNSLEILPGAPEIFRA